MTNTFHRTTYTVTVLSEDPVHPEADLREVLDRANYEDYVATAPMSRVEELTGKQMADALYEAGSDPAFFRLNDDGEPVE